MKIYEILFYGDSVNEMPFICKINDEMVYEKFLLGVPFIGDKKIELKIIQDGIKDNFLENTQKLLIIDSKVKNVLDMNDFQEVEYIPIEIENQIYYIINVLKVNSDCLNLEKSKILRFPSDFPNLNVRGKIGTIWKTVLYKEKIQGHIFRIKEYPSDIYVDELFKCLIEENGFTGIHFRNIELY